jgi:hypothetical protein
LNSRSGASCVPGRDSTDDPQGALPERRAYGLPSHRPRPRKGSGKGGTGEIAAAAGFPQRPKIHCDNALTAPESGLYCAPLAALAAMRRGSERGLKKAQSKVDGRWQTAILPPPFGRHAVTRDGAARGNACRTSLARRHGKLFKNSAGNLCGDSCQ